MKPPIMRKEEHITKVHNYELKDDYFWFKNKESSEVIDHLNAENNYTDSVLEPHKKTQEILFNELKNRIKEEDSSYPIKHGDYFYYSKDMAGLEHKIYCRKKGDLSAEEETLLDMNIIAKDYDYCKLGVFEVSPDHKTLAYSIDIDGSENYKLSFKNLETGQLLEDSITGTYYSLEWANDSKTIIYNVLNDKERPALVYLYEVGSQQEPQLIFEETDPELFVSLYKSRSEKFIYIHCFGAITTEVHFIDANQPKGSIELFLERKNGVEYSLEDNGDDLFYVSHNEGLQNFELCSCPINNREKSNWQVVVKHNPDVFLRDFDVFKNYLVITESEKGLDHLKLLNLKTQESSRAQMPEDNYSIEGYSNPQFDSENYLLYYSSLVTPPSVLELNFADLKVTSKKEKEIPTYNKNDYVTERKMAESHDGTLVPISIIYKKDTPLDGTAPCYLYAYGSYGVNMPPDYRSHLFSLVDRGFVFAIAHIRGGSDVGRNWYENGKLLKKKNTFLDFIASAEYLIKENYTAKQNIVIVGRSAGGLLVGATVNMRPDLYKAAIAGVPFVDMINTMLDDSLPLTTIEYDEWGNPNDKEYFDYMMSYSPYDNVEKKDYPHIFITAGLNDPRVTYWEPAKWAAKLREYKTDSNLVLLKTNMEAGHGGQSGRYAILKEVAEEYTFVLSVFDKI